MDDGFQVHLFRSKQRKSPGQVKPHLVPENTDCSDARPVGFPVAILKDVVEKSQVLLHFFE